MERIYGVYENYDCFDDEFPDGLSENEVLESFYNSTSEPEFIESFLYLENAEKEAKKGIETKRENGKIYVTFRYINEVYYENDDIVDMFTIEKFAKPLEK